MYLADYENETFIIYIKSDIIKWIIKMHKLKYSDCGIFCSIIIIDRWDNYSSHY